VKKRKSVCEARQVKADGKSEAKTRDRNQDRRERIGKRVSADLSLLVETC